MSIIKISDLYSSGEDLFSDSETFLNELGEPEMELIKGGECFSFVSIKSAEIGLKTVRYIVSCNTIGNVDVILE